MIGHGFVGIEDDIVDKHLESIGPQALLIYVALMRIADIGSDPWHKEVSRLTGESAASVNRSLVVLAQHGLVRRIETDGTLVAYYVPRSTHRILMLESTQPVATVQHKPQETRQREEFQSAPDDMVKQFWSVYPKKAMLGKLKDQLPKTIATLREETGKTDDVIFKRLLECAQEYRDSPAGQDSVDEASDSRPNPALWLADERFRDDRKTWQIRNGAAAKRSVREPAKTPTVKPRPVESRRRKAEDVGDEMQRMLTDG